MDFFIVYLACALIVAVGSYVGIFRPVIILAKEAGLKSNLIDYPVLSAISFMAFSMLFAPLMFIILMSTSLTQAFITGAYAGMFED